MYGSSYSSGARTRRLAGRLAGGAQAETGASARTRRGAMRATDTGELTGRAATGTETAVTPAAGPG